uniref:Cation-transporting P-type ATPase C-terminal domain-containing protein n=1 Tax=Salix viminalis TaxID=40686 RepID=A0A6N2MUY2_SALVM
MDVRERNTFKQIIQGMAANSLRSIAFAHKQLSEEQYEDGKEEKGLKEDSLTLLGIVGIKDPCRPGVKKVVDDCQHAGVNIKMISGDKVFTARAITIECGILNPVSVKICFEIQDTSYTSPPKTSKRRHEPYCGSLLCNE